VQQAEDIDPPEPAATNGDPQPSVDAKLSATGTAVPVDHDRAATHWLLMALAPGAIAAMALARARAKQRMDGISN